MSRNDGGTPIGLATSRRAPFGDKFLTVQSMLPPPNAIVPLFKTLFRSTPRFSIISVAPFSDG
jgi:hypothetical protein